MSCFQQILAHYAFGFFLHIMSLAYLIHRYSSNLELVERELTEARQETNDAKKMLEKEEETNEQLLKQIDLANIHGERSEERITMLRNQSNLYAKLLAESEKVVEALNTKLAGVVSSATRLVEDAEMPALISH